MKNRRINVKSMVMKIFSVLIAFCAYLLMTVVSFIFNVTESSVEISMQVLC